MEDVNLEIMLVTWKVSDSGQKGLVKAVILQRWSGLITIVGSDKSVC